MAAFKLQFYFPGNTDGKIEGRWITFSQGFVNGRFSWAEGQPDGGESANALLMRRGNDGSFYGNEEDANGFQSPFLCPFQL